MSYLYWIIFIGIALLSWVVSKVLDHRFTKYSKSPISESGKEVAERMLRENGIDNVRVVCVSGRLTDHYNPSDMTLNLSEAVYGERNIAAAAVAAHECGHAVQHAKGYAFLQLRSAMVPMVSFSSKWVTWVILAGMLLINVFPKLLLIGIGLFAVTTLFSFVTLPVEIDASRRALVWLRDAGISSDREYNTMATKALRSAAYTYVVAALSSLATLMYYIFIYLRRN